MIIINDRIRIVKKIICCITLFILCFACMSKKVVYARYDYETIRGCWFSYLDFEVYLKDKDEITFKDNLNIIINKLEENNINTLYIQVRPMGDAIYPSKYFPVSEYISTDRKEIDYDCLEIIIKECHNRKIRVEAWINPYRLSKDEKTTESYKKTEQYKEYKNIIYSYMNSKNEECLSLDPTMQKSNELIVNGVCEIVENYDIDGIHFDDYFFIDGIYDDMDVDRKKQYVNSLVSQVYESVKAIKPDCEFGISPSGNVDVAEKQGADVKLWLSTPGYIDYLIPQIYWTDNYEKTDGEIVPMFSNMARRWMELNLLDVKMPVGLALYRAGEESKSDHGWSLYNNNLMEYYRFSCDLNYDGYILFRYEWLNMDVSIDELNYLKSFNEEQITIYIKNMIDDILCFSFGNINTY